MKVFSIFLLAACMAVGAFTGPEGVDETAHWSVGSWGHSATEKFVKFSSLTKKVMPTNYSFDKTVFHTVTVFGAKVGGTMRKIAGPIAGTRQEYEDVYFGYMVRKEQYALEGVSRRLGVSLYLNKDGRFTLEFAWLNGTAAGADEVYVRWDYDLDGASNDIVEYSAIESGMRKWTAAKVETQIIFPSLGNQIPNVLEGDALFRTVDAGSPVMQFGAVFWPYFYSPITLYMKKYSTPSPSLPTVNSSITIQKTATATGYRPYAYSGMDQEAWTLVRMGPTQSNFGVQGKVFQKPNGRSLRINTHIMTGATDYDLDYVVDHGRSASSAFNEMSWSRWSQNKKTGLPNPYGTHITRAQLHEFMTNSRNAGPNSYTIANWQNVRDWTVDVNILNCVISGSEGIYGTMFDWPGYGDANNVAREGTAIMDKAVRDRALSGGSSAHDVLRFRGFLFAHEVGHALNVNHEWDGCGTNLLAPYCVDGHLMTYSLMMTGQPGGTGVSGNNQMTFSPAVQNFIWYGPESWVKPGLFGVPWYQSGTAPPAFTPYGTP